MKHFIHITAHAAHPVQPMVRFLGIFVLVNLTSVSTVAAQPEPTIEDIFGRNLEGHGLVLVDWEGYIANPAIKFFVSPPPRAALPVKAVLKSKEPRLYFDLPSHATPDGPGKEMTFTTPEKQPVHVAIFPDRDGRDEHHTVEIEFTDARGKKTALTLPVLVVDQDRDREGQFSIGVDFSQDTTGFFSDERLRAVVLEAVNDWAYYLDGTGLAAVPAGAETTFIWNSDGFKSGRDVTNAAKYQGYLLYAYGIRGEELRSGGEPSWHGQFQRRGNEVLPIRRSGGLEIEVQGNYNRKGWMIGLADTDWWKAVNLRETVPDLYSIAHHEIGHALFFNAANRRVKHGAKVDDAELRAYLGSNPAIDRTDHFAGVVDPASLRGSFGNEYHGRVPLGRWLITKHDLLAAQAIGYKLRPTSPLAPFSLPDQRLPPGKLAVAYSAKIRAEGGIPVYDWKVVAGALPEGLALDSFTGEIRGEAKRAGKFEFTVRVRDYDERGTGMTRQLRLVVGER